MLKQLMKRLKAPAVPTEETARARRPLSGALGRPWNPDDLVGRKGLEIYDQMQTDSQISACLATKKHSVLSRGWKIVPGGNSPEDRRAASFCQHALTHTRTSLEDALYGVLDALAKGYSILELNFRIEPDGPWQGLVGLDSIKHKDPSLFEFVTDRFMNVAALKRTGTDGEPEQILPRQKFVVYSYNPSHEDPRGRSDLRSCYRHWWAKDILQRFFCSYLERFGSPVVMGVYKRGTTPGQQEELLRVLDRLQHETAMVIPEDIRVELLEAAFHGEQGFLDALSYHDRQIAKAILGQTLTQEEGQRTGALALAKVHESTMKMRLLKLKRDLEEQVMARQVLAPIVRLNFAHANVPQFRLGSFAERDLAQQSAVLERLVRTGAVDPGEAWIRPWLGIECEEQQPG